MLKTTIITCLILVQISCGSLIRMNEDNPPKKSFKYYNPNFEFDNSSGLKIERKYSLYDSTATSLLIFFRDGFLNKLISSKPELEVPDRKVSGVIIVYYKSIGDSIFFTTKSYYQNRPVYYKGLIKNDTLKLEVHYPDRKMPEMEQYVLSK